jgi:hypothetical protein
MGKIENNEVIIVRVLKYQNLDLVHPLTCGVDIRHQFLDIRVNDENEVKLYCIDCDYEGRVPLMFYDDSIDEIIDYQEKAQESFKV